MKYNQDGVFRSFAFIGYRSEDQAKAAHEYFNNNYVQTSKIKVELCVKEENAAVPKMEPTTVEKIRGVRDEFKEMMQKPEFQEFLKVQRNLGKRKAIWDDDTVMDEVLSKYKEAAEDPSASSSNERLPKKFKLESNAVVKTEGDEEKKTNKMTNKLVHKFTLAVRNIPQNKRNKTNIREFFAPVELSNIRLPQVKSVAYVSFLNESDLRAALVKHKSFLGKKQVLLQPTNLKDTTHAKLEFNRVKNRLEKSVSVKNIEQTGRLFVRNLSYSCTREDLETLFNTYGPTAEVTLPVDTETEKIKGFAFITYVFPEHAMKAFSELDRSTFQGRLLHVIPAEAKPNDDYNQMPHGSSSAFKKRKTDELKSEATRSHNWNALFLSANAVADILSSKLNIKKSELLMNDVGKKDSLAARMALGETQLVKETKHFLEQNNVSLESFDDEDVKRSRTVMLVKNLPANTTEGELTELVSKFGKIKRLLMPPYGATAIVEFNTDAVAHQAFKKLAYMKFKRIPLYLEWAPVDVFKKETNDVSSTNGSKTQKTSSRQDGADSEMNKEIEQSENNREEEERQPEPNTILYVKNLNGLTSSIALKEHFSQCGKVFNVTISEKKDPDGTVSSMGYGFVQFYFEKDAKKALRKLELSMLDGNALNVKLSANTLTWVLVWVWLFLDYLINLIFKLIAFYRNQSIKTKSNNPISKVSTKIIVKNVPFEATEKDLTQLFRYSETLICPPIKKFEYNLISSAIFVNSFHFFTFFRPFGQLQSVRLPKKLVGSGSHRGFAFVEYALKTEAKVKFCLLNKIKLLFSNQK